MPREQIFDEISNDKVWSTSPSIDHSAVQDLRRRIPLDVNCSFSIRFDAAQLRPAGRAPRLMLLQYFQSVFFESRIARDGFA